MRITLTKDGGRYFCLGRGDFAVMVWRQAEQLQCAEVCCTTTTYGLLLHFV